MQNAHTSHTQQMRRNFVCLPVSSVLANVATLLCSEHTLQFLCLSFHSSSSASCSAIYHLFIVLCKCFVLVYGIEVCFFRLLNSNLIVFFFWSSLINWFHGQAIEPSKPKFPIDLEYFFFLCRHSMSIFSIKQYTPYKSWHIYFWND